MSTDDDNKFMDELRAARPAFQPSAEEWASGDRAREVLEPVLAVAETAGPRPEPARPAGGSRHAGRAGVRWWTRPRLAFAGGVLMLVVLAVSLAVVFAGGTADREPLATERVSKLSAVEDLMPLFLLKEGQTFDSLTHPAPDSLSRVNEAVASGLLMKAEVSDGSAAKPMTEAQYAVLLVKAFKTVLPQGTHPILPIDTKATADERTAMDTLAASGIILASDEPFGASEALTKDVESRLLQRIEEALRHLTAG